MPDLTRQNNPAVAKGPGLSGNLWMNASPPKAAALLPSHARRDPFIDGLRGIFHVILVVDHLPFLLPGIFTLLERLYEPLGYATVAEGFVFLSGYVSGLVYTRILREKGRKMMWRKALVRSRDIYVCYVVAVLLLVFMVKSLGYSRISWQAWQPLFEQHLSATLIQVCALLKQPTFLEILPMYAIFLLFTPLLIGQLERGRALIILAASLLLWTAGQFDLRDGLVDHLLPPGISNLGFFNSFGWQILFISGLVCGHKSFNTKLPWLPFGWKLAGVALALAVVFFAMRHNLVAPLHVDEQLVSRSSLGPLRLLNVLCLIILLAKARKFIARGVAWKGFAFLSKHSLQVFAFHLFPIYLITLVVGIYARLAVVQLMVIAFCIASLFQIAFFARFFKTLAPGARE